MNLLAILSFVGIGAAAGFLAGLLGVGGGLIIVPALIATFAGLAFPEAHILHLALGTSLASIVFTSLSSLRAHHGHGAVRWDVVRAMGPSLLLGTAAGSLLAGQISSFALQCFFVGFVFLVAVQMLAGFKPKPSYTLPTWPIMTTVGGVIGGISSLVGIGGGSLSVPFLILCNVRMPEAVGTSAALGLPIALGGLVGYAIVGSGSSLLPAYSLGFIYLPALAGIVLASVLTAPLGAKLAHQLPIATLKKCFAALLLIIASRMLFKIWMSL